MPNRIHLSDDLREITPDIFTTASAIIGIRGSGKTTDGVVLAENAVRLGVPVVVIDAVSAWWGLKSSADGKSAGLPFYIFGGQHADVPLEIEAGPLVARFLVDNPVPAILDLSDYSKTKQRRFVGHFLEALFNLKNRKRDPLYVIIDEVQRFCPQQRLEKDPDLSRCVGAVEDIGSLGRGRGLGLAIIGPRPATINKNVLATCDNLFAMRTVGTQDRKAIDEWVTEAQGEQKQRDELVQNIAGLKTGEGYFWSPAIFGVFRRVQFANRTTFDSSRTPKVGEKRVEARVFAEVDLDALSAEIAATVERAKADDPKALRATIAGLEKRLAAKGAADPAEVTALRARVAELETEVAGLREDVRFAEQHADAADEAIDAARTILGRFPVASKPRAGAAPIPARPEPVARPQRPAPMVAAVAAPTARPARPAAQHRAEGDVAVKAGARRMLEQLARMGGTLTKRQLGTLAGVKHTSGTFASYLSALRSNEYIESDISTVSITAEGAAAIGERVRRDPLSTAEVVAMYAPKLKEGARRMLDVLVTSGGAPIAKADLADKSGISAASGTFASYLSSLRSNGLLDDVDSRRVKASDALFD